MTWRIGGSWGVVLGVAILGLWSQASVASAQTDDETRARGHFEAGSSYFEEGEYEDALREFGRAYDLSHRPGLLYNIALANERIGEYAEAARALRQYLAEATEVPNRGTLEHRIEALERRASGSEADSADESPDAADEQLIDDTPGQAAPPTATQAAPVEPSEPSGTGATRSGGTDLTLPAIMSFAVGGAGIALFAVAGGLALSEYSSLQSGCGAMTACAPAQADSVRLLAALADVGIVVGALGVAAGVVLLLVSDPGGSPDSSASVRFAPWATDVGGGLLVGGAL